MKKMIAAVLILSALIMASCSTPPETQYLSGDISRTDGPEKNWGITLTAENVFPTGLTIICTQSGGSPSGELSSGSPFWVERQESSSWEEVEVLPQEYDIAWTAEAWIIPFNDSVKWNIGWEGFYGDLPAGAYRIAKEIMDFRGPGDYEQAVFYAEFEIE